MGRRGEPYQVKAVREVSTAVGCDGRSSAAGMSSETVPEAEAAGHSLSPAVSAAGGGAASTVAKSSEAECDSGRENRNSGDVREKAFTERDESKGSGGGWEAGTTTTTTILTSSSTRRKGRALGNEGCSDLLLEAVRQVSGSAFDEDDDTEGAEKREPAATEEEEEKASPALAPGRARRSAGGGVQEKRRRSAGSRSTSMKMTPLRSCGQSGGEKGRRRAPLLASSRGRLPLLASSGAAASKEQHLGHSGKEATPARESLQRGRRSR